MKDSAIERTSDFKNFKDLTPEQHNKVYENSKANFPELTTTASDFARIFNYLSEKQRAELINGPLKAKIPILINTVTDFGLICEVLTKKQCDELFEGSKKYLYEHIETATDFQHVCQFINEKQRDKLFKNLEVKLPELIKTLPDFLFIFSRLSKEQHTKLVDGSLKEKLPKLIETISDFDIISKFLTGKQSYELFESLKENRSEFVRATLNINDVLEFLTEEQYQFFKTQFSLNAVHTKCEQLNKGFTRLFFKDISQQKHRILSEVFELAKTIIHNKDTYENNSVQFEKIKKIVEDNQATLKTHRGFFKLHTTTSNQITDGLVNHLEYLIAMNK